MRKPSEIIINGKTLAEILENHHHWLMEDVDGWEDMCAKLEGANLYCTNLSGANLKCADLRGSNLRGADLSGANLYCTNLSGADIYCTNLSGADLSGANLSGANLSGANLKCADLRGSNLRGADLKGANLSGANLKCADLYYSNLSGAKNIPYIPLECPSEGSFIGWKKIDKILIKLEIPEDARRSSATTKKCRCDKAKVLGFYGSLGSQELNMTELVNDRYEECKYVKGEMVYPDYFDDNRWDECSHGIHFFINKQDAINYDC